ncbi:MAG TPA: CBS domain-containing protein [Myxococcota bacterium]|jgi:signal-transduction protein with cAMP-binding, CBS, and nucleotidyltransferase domain|nr:CBS domain-containing protein [Myxococcota bacterium]
MATVHPYEKDVTTLPESASVFELATAMQEGSVGCVVVVDADQHPRGIVTDRDLAVRVISRERDAAGLTASAVMTSPIIAAEATDPLAHVIDLMGRNGIRRVPIVRDGRVTGIVALDDVLAEIGRELDDLGGVARRQIIEARLAASLPRLREEIESRLSELVDRLQQVRSRATETLGREFEELRERVKRTLQ